MHVLGAALSDNPGFDPVKDFTHIAFLGGAPSVIVAHPSIGVKTMKEMLAYARGLAKEMPYVSSGTGTVGHVVFEYVVVKEKLNAVHVPYRAGSAAVVDLLAGRVTVGALNWATARQHVQAGTLIPLGVSSAKRLPQLPDLPTLAELGYPDIQTTTWTMISGPPGLAEEYRRCGQPRGASDRGEARAQEAFRERGRGAAAAVAGGADQPGAGRGRPLGAGGARDGEEVSGLCVPGAISAFTRVFDALWQHEMMRCRPGTPVS